MKKLIFLAGLASIVVISSLVAAESEEPIPLPKQLVGDLSPVSIDEFDPAAGITALSQPEVCAASVALGLSSSINPICINCTTQQQCAFACGSSGSCFPDFFSLCGGPPTNNICYCA